MAQTAGCSRLQLQPEASKMDPPNFFQNTQLIHVASSKLGGRKLNAPPSLSPRFAANVFVNVTPQKWQSKQAPQIYPRQKRL